MKRLFSLTYLRTFSAILQYIVDTNNEKRFAFNNDLTKITASQGHSVEVDLNYKKQQPPDILYHGTVEKFPASILSEGLKKMNRHHVHLTHIAATISSNVKN